MMDEAHYPGVLVLVVGPSGAGKDSLLRRARADLSGDERFIFVRRAVTRPSDPANEEVDTISDRDVAIREVAGEFALSWQVHGLSYGLPRSVIQPALARGRCVIAQGLGGHQPLPACARLRSGL